MVGSPATIVERPARYHDLGFDDVMVRYIAGEHALMLRSLELIGAQVMAAIHKL